MANDLPAKENINRPLVIIAGPTATGKTSASVELAKRLEGSVISADSMQVLSDRYGGSPRPLERRSFPEGSTGGGS